MKNLVIYNHDFFFAVFETIDHIASNFLCKVKEPSQHSRPSEEVLDVNVEALEY